MSTSGVPDSVAGGRVAVAASRLWAGGVATAFVAALVAAVGVLLFSSVMDIRFVRLPVLLQITDSLALNYAATAFVFALAATGLAHLLTVTTPRPSVFFGWIVGLVTVAMMVMPFAFDASTASKVSTALINMIIGIAIGSLLSAVLARTVVVKAARLSQ
jgi:hypothetical protein